MATPSRWRRAKSCPRAPRSAAAALVVATDAESISGWLLALSIRYLVRDVDAAVAFYVEHLGFSLVNRMGPAFAIIERDGLSLWLSGPQTSAAQAMPDGRVPGPGGWNRLVIEVEDVTAEVERLRSAGVVFRNEPLSGPGGTQVVIDDPSGNPIELFSPR